MNSRFLPCAERGASHSPRFPSPSAMLARLARTLCAISALAASGLTWASSVEVDRIVAVVNDEVVTARELSQRVEQSLRQIKRQGVQLPAADEFRKQVLERLILDRAQLQLARQQGIRVDNTMIDRAIERIAETNRISVAALRQGLEKDGVSWSRFRQNLQDEILLTRLREREVDSKVMVTDAEVDNFLQNNPDALSGEEVLVAHILLRAPENASPDQLARLRARAEEARRRIEGGEAFGRVAATMSDAPDAMNGGMLGWRPASRLPALFADALTRMKPGDLSPVMRSAAGFHLLFYADKRGGVLAGGAQVQQTRARHILIKTSEVLSDNDAQHRLAALRERIVNGTDFAELAKVHSADLSAAKGGDLGWIMPGDTVPEFEREMNALKPGETSQPVRSPFGWHLIKVEERRTQDLTEERKRTLARNALRERKADEAYNDWLRQLRDRTFVEYRLEEAQ